MITINIPVYKISPHPDNPRKDVGDVSELAESIKKNGIMQNLTVIPKEEGITKTQINADTEYTVLIGHRRLAAAKAAGVLEVPCHVVFGMSHNEQITTMLEENMQRADLTIPEQAEGFQMMLDLGETVDTIKAKTGFSETTIYHRLNLAKLDKKILKKRFAEPKEDSKETYFQLSLTDMYQLEKVKDIKTRNGLLENANSSFQLQNDIRGAVREEKVQDYVNALKPLLEEVGIVPAPKEYIQDRWSTKWETVRRYDFDKPLPKKVIGGNGWFWYKEYSSVNIIKRTAKKEKPKKTPEDIKREEVNKNKKHIEEILKKMARERKTFLLEIIDENPKNDMDIAAVAWECLKKTFYLREIEDTADIFDAADDDDDDNSEMAEDNLKRYNALPLSVQMILYANRSVENGDLEDWYCHYNDDSGERYKALYSALGILGMFITDPEEQAVLDGTSELYTKPDKQ